MNEQRKSEHGRNARTLFDEAAELLLRLHEPDSGVAELENLESWRRRSPKHGAVAAEVEQLWSDIGHIRDLPWPSEAEIAGDRENDQESGGRSRFASLVRPRVAGGAIAALVLVALTVLFAYRPPPTIFETEVGEHRLVHLADGSEVMLGARSRMRISFDDEERLVFLDFGEGLFTVTEDLARPFNVDTGNVNVRVVGTAFNVRNGPQYVVVSVIDGIVRVSGSDAPLDETFPLTSDGVISRDPAPFTVDQDLIVGERLTIGKTDSSAKLEAASVTNAIAWREGRFVFSGESLASVVAELNRYSVSQIEIADEELAELMISGTVLRNQIADWLEGLERAFPVRIDRVDGTRVIIRTSDRPQDTAI